MDQKINETLNYIRSVTDFIPSAGVILGSGLGNFAEKELSIEFKLEYPQIPHFPISTVKGHTGNLIFGTVGKTKVVALQGRFHYYEGYSMKDITYPVRVLKELGINYLLLSNACGGINSDYKVGDLMLIDDHINLFFDNPLIGINDDSLGPRFLDMSMPYDKDLIQLAQQVAKNCSIPVHTGVYAAVSGPCFETRAEIRFLKTIGADVIGMSTIPEVIVARHRGLKCLAISIITDIGSPDFSVQVSHEEVLKAANLAAPKMDLIFREVLLNLPPAQ